MFPTACLRADRCFQSGAQARCGRRPIDSSHSLGVVSKHCNGFVVVGITRPISCTSTGIKTHAPTSRLTLAARRSIGCASLSRHKLIPAAWTDGSLLRVARCVLCENLDIIAL